MSTQARSPRILASLVLVLFVLGLSSPSYAVPGDGVGNGNASANGQANSQANSQAHAKSADKPTTKSTGKPAAKNENSPKSSGGEQSTQVLTDPQPLSNADQNEGGANGQCPGGAYCSTRDGSPSLNGNGDGEAVGKPCAGCVGKADNKNPKGQLPDGSDHNAGYECDRNKGIGKTNPAHTGCVTPPLVDEEECPDGSPLVEGEECEVSDDEEEVCPDGSAVVEGEECDEVAGVEKERPRAPVVTSPPTGVLPSTGVASSEELLALGGAAMLLSGLGLLVARRRLS